MPTPPTEIIHFIISNIPSEKGRRDLASVCLASHDLCAIGREYLYRDVVLDSIVTAIKACRALASNNELARCVRRLNLQALWRAARPEPNPATFNAVEVFADAIARPPDGLRERLRSGSVLTGFLYLLASALRACTRLTSLTLGERGSYGWVLNDTTFHLTHFENHSRFDPSIVAFLSRQDTILRLLLSHTCGFLIEPGISQTIQSVPVDCCPRLSGVEMPAWYAPALVRNRPVRRFGCTIPADNVEMAHLLRTLSTSTGPLVTIFVTMSNKPSSDMIQALALNVGLQSVTIIYSPIFQPIIPLGQDEEPDIGQNMAVLLQPENLLAITSMTVLSSFTFMVTADHTGDLEELGGAVAHGWGACCPSLRSVILSTNRSKSVWTRLPGATGVKLQDAFGAPSPTQDAWMSRSRTLFGTAALGAQ